MADNWTPVLSADGQFYCSPACGGCNFCRKEWYDAAVVAADELCARLGDGWKPEIHENLGWHYSAKKGVVTVRPGEPNGRPSTSYSAWIEPGVMLRQFAFQVIAYGPTPEDALGNATQDARTLIARINNALSDLLEPAAA